MFYSNLLKGVAIVAMAVVLTSCGGVKTQEVVLEEIVKIPSQKIEFSIKEFNTKKGTFYFLQSSSVVIEALKDVSWIGKIYIRLYDKDGVELIALMENELPEKAGEKKKCEFSSTFGDCDKSKRELKDIIKQTKSVEFRSENLTEK